MSRSTKRFSTVVRAALAALSLGFAPLPAQAEPTDLNDIPMAVANSVKANFLIVLDNSQSMDALMGGALQSGNNTLTRSNIGRPVLRSMLDDYRTTFKWGLMSFDTGNTVLSKTHVYYVGDESSMVFTDKCENGVSSTNGRRCVANPQPFAGGNFVTYEMSSDDPQILDAFYDTASRPSIWAISPPGAAKGETSYDLWFRHVPGSGTDWAISEFADHRGMGHFSLTDAGYTPAYPGVTRQLMLPRGWGYFAPITGGGKLWEAVAPDANEHYKALVEPLAAETDGATKEIKNSALYTPLAGTFDSAKNYFSGVADWSSKVKYKSPIEAWCQKNFVMLLTDGLPTGDKTGALYSTEARTDTCSALSGDGKTCTGSWTFGKAANDAFDAVGALRSVSYTDAACVGCSTFDIQTYVIAMGTAQDNARAVAIMNEMAKRGSCKPGDEKSCKNAFFASDPETLKTSVDQAVSDAVAQYGAAASVAVANANITETTSLYQSSYNAENWTGDLESFKLNVTTGEPIGVRNWSAQEELGKRSADSRKIVSYDGSAHGIQFRPSTAGTVTALSKDQEKLISKSDAAGIINYLRGDRSGETATDLVEPKYRQRKPAKWNIVLGDIINSEPVLLMPPSAVFSETIDKGYAAFKKAAAKRPAVVFQGANDGMLHAFNADTGTEEWAYVPSLLLPTLAGLSRVHGFSHHYYVDGTPTVSDVDFDRTGGAAGTGEPDWRTILVGGLGKGGRGYYALDVTNGTPADEAGVAANVLWEFPNSSTPPQVVANLGYSFGKPVIAKAGDQGWVVLVTSGYNNTEPITVTVEGASTTYTGDGKGHLFVLNAKTGEVIGDISTDVGSSETPSGLAAFSAYLEGANVDNTVTQVYAGDLDGNVWRFDLSGESTDWTVSKLAALVDSGGKTQPVTTAPELATILDGGVTYRFVYVGTGRYLGGIDVTTTQTQTMYGLVDDRSATPLIAPLRGDSGKLQQQTLSAPFSVTDSDGNTTVQRTASAKKVALAGDGKKRGWYVDLPVSGERISTDPQLAPDGLVFTSNIPSGVLCVPGGSSYLNILDYRTGGALEATKLTWASKFLGNALASRPVLVRLSSGEVRVLIRLSSGETVAEGFPPPPPPKVRRVSWRELPDSSK